MKRIERMKKSLTVILAAFAALSCQKSRVDSELLPPVWPDYTFVTVPVNIAPLNFGLEESYNFSRMKVDVIDGNGKKVLSSSGKCAQFPVGKWHRVLADAAGGKLSFEVSVLAGGTWTDYAPFDIDVSRDSIDYGLTYRMIPPGYQSFGHMGIYERNLGNFRQRTLMDTRMIESGCVNCHTENRGDPNSFSLHIRGKHSATYMRVNGEYECLNTITDSTGGFFVYPYWHPTGKYIAYSVNRTRQSFYSSADRMLEVYDETSDVIVYCPETHKILRPAASNRKDKFETMPTFSADGKTLYYSVSNAGELPKDALKMMYSLCALPFDPETGRFGEKADTLFSASQTGHTYIYPKPSYDGNYLLISVFDYGTLPINHPESDLWLYDLNTGDFYPADGINSDDAESFHNWSTNSRWAVVCTRRDDGMYTRLYIAHFDPGKKNFDKAFLLPQKDPVAYYTDLGYSFSTPDFTLGRVPMDVRRARKMLLSKDRTPVSVLTDTTLNIK